MSQQPKVSHLRVEINELAAAMHESGTLDAATLKKITMRGRSRTEAAPLAVVPLNVIRRHGAKTIIS